MHIVMFLTLFAPITQSTAVAIEDEIFSDTCTTKTCHDLANRFDIAASTVSRIFQKWLDNMYSKLDFLIIWPKREVVRQNLPLYFKSLYLNTSSRCRIVLVPVQRPNRTTRNILL